MFVLKHCQFPNNQPTKFNQPS